MIINNKSWHYKLYEYTYSWSIVNNWLPERTNLCQYVQRIIWMGLVMSVLCYGIILPIWFTTVYGVLTPFALLIGKKPKAPWKLVQDKGFGAAELDIFNQYSLPKIHDVRILPAYLLVPLGLLFAEVYGWHHSVPTTLTIHLIVLGLAIFIVGLMFLVDSKSETAVLALLYLYQEEERVSFG